MVNFPNNNTPRSTSNTLKTPSAGNTNEKPLLSLEYIDPEFLKGFPGGFDVLKETAKKNEVVELGRGAISFAQLYKFSNDKQYIVRIMRHGKENSHIRAEKEIEIYKKLKEASDYTEYISDLVFAKDVIDDYGLATYFIFVYDRGNTLDKYIKSNNKTKSFDEIRSIYNRLKECLAFIHRNGVVHRDISPDNIFMTKEKLLLFDFDASCLEGIDCDSHDFKGKVHYATKNALNKRGLGETSFGIYYYYTPSTDNYALAVILKNDLIQLAKTDDDEKKVTDFAEKEFSLISKEMNKKTHTRTSKGGMRKGRRTRKTKKGGYNRTAMGFPKFGGTATTACSSCTHQQTKFPASELLRGGACPCAMAPQLQGGYKATKRNLKYLKLWKQGKSIGFTMRSSLKAKGLIPRANGTYRVSPKYR